MSLEWEEEEGEQEGRVRGGGGRWRGTFSRPQLSWVSSSAPGRKGVEWERIGEGVLPLPSSSGPHCGIPQYSLRPFELWT